MFRCGSEKYPYRCQISKQQGSVWTYGNDDAVKGCGNGCKCCNPGNRFEMR